MGSSPKLSVSEAEKANAEVGAYKSARFRRLYSPLSKQELADASTDDYKQIARGRSNADVNQAAGNTNAASVLKGDTTRATSLMDGLQKGLQKADDKAATIQNKRQSNVLSSVQQQGAVNTDAMGQLASIKANDAIASMKASETKNMAAFKALAQVGGAAGAKAAADGDSEKLNAFMAALRGG